MKQNRLVISLVTLVAAALGTFMFAQVSFSQTFTSTYYSNDRTIIENGVVVFVDPSLGTGWYQLPDGSNGTLSFNVDHSQLPNLTYYGPWTYYGDCGTFTWTVYNNSTAFLGSGRTRPAMKPANGTAIKMHTRLRGRSPGSPCR